MSRWVVRDDLQSSLSTSTILWICDLFAVSYGESTGGSVRMLLGQAKLMTQDIHHVLSQDGHICIAVPHGLTLCLCPRNQPYISGLFWVRSPGEKKNKDFKGGSVASKLALNKVRDLVCISSCISSLKCSVYIQPILYLHCSKLPRLKKK